MITKDKIKLNVTGKPTCQKADQQSTNSCDENGKRTVPQIRHLIDRQIPWPAATTKR